MKWCVLTRSVFGDRCLDSIYCMFLCWCYCCCCCLFSYYCCYCCCYCRCPLLLLSVYICIFIFLFFEFLFHSFVHMTQHYNIVRRAIFIWRKKKKSVIHSKCTQTQFNAASLLVCWCVDVCMCVFSTWVILLSLLLGFLFEKLTPKWNWI